MRKALFFLFLCFYGVFPMERENHGNVSGERFTSLKNDITPDLDVTDLKLCGRVYSNCLGKIKLFPNVRSIAARGIAECFKVNEWEDFFEALRDLPHLESLDLAYQTFDSKLLKFVPMTVKYLNISFSSVDNLRYLTVHPGLVIDISGLKIKTKKVLRNGLVEQGVKLIEDSLQ